MFAYSSHEKVTQKLDKGKSHVATLKQSLVMGNLARCLSFSKQVLSTSLLANGGKAE